MKCKLDPLAPSLIEPSEFKNKITNHLDNNDTLEIGTDDKLDKANGSDCGGNSYCDKREAFKKKAWTT